MRLDKQGRPWSDILTEAAGRTPAEAGVYQANSRVRVEMPIANTPRKVDIGRKYHWRSMCKDGLLVWHIDGAELMRFDDLLPLKGKEHRRFWFLSWDAQLYFDNLEIETM